MPLGLSLSLSGGALDSAQAVEGNRAASFSDTQAWRFDGASQAFTTVAAPDFFSGSGVTFSFWVKDDGIASKIFIQQRASDSERYRIGFSGGYPLFQNYASAGNSTFLAGATISNDTYTHVCWSIDISSTSNFLANTKCYLNGVDAGKFLGGAANSCASLDFQHGSTHFVGLADAATFIHIDELNEYAVWDVAMTAAQVTALYNSGAALDLSTNSGDYNVSSDLRFWARGEETIGTNAPFYSWTESSSNSLAMYSFGNVSQITSTL
jgi:hypothetical protein